MANSGTGRLAIVGTGFVADLYMRSLRTFPNITVASAFDTDPQRLKQRCDYWGVAPAKSLDELLDARSPKLILNLTNPRSHYQVSRAALTAGKDLYSEKPLALTMDEAYALCDLARSKNLFLASAPCSLLGEAAQTLWLAVRRQTIGSVRLVYAELDDDFVAKAPYRAWFSQSGAPWPYRDE